MNLNRWFRKAEEHLHLDRDPTEKFTFDPTLDTHKKLLEDLRKTILAQTDQCFRLCADAKLTSLSPAESSCVQSCVKDNIEAVKQLMKRAADKS